MFPKTMLRVGQGMGKSVIVIHLLFLGAKINIIYLNGYQISDGKTNVILKPLTEAL